MNTITIHKDSHLDHGLTDAHIAWLKTLSVPTGFCKQELEIPSDLGPLDCALYGPKMDDAPVADSETFQMVRGNRSGASRMIRKPARKSRTITVMTGDHDGMSGVLFTAFGGPGGERETFEFAADDESPAAVASREFWATHALAAE